MQACAQAYRDCVKAKSCKVTTRRDLAAGTLELRKIKSVGHLVEAPRDLHIENTSNQKVEFSTKKEQLEEISLPVHVSCENSSMVAS